MTARYRAPAADGGVLAEPAFADLRTQLEANRRRLAADVRVAGIPLSEFRATAAREVVGAARRLFAEAGEMASHAEAGLLMAGHQPDLFHPGVWAKNFALHALAKTHGLQPLNLVVDNDTPHAAALKIPVPTADPQHTTAVSVPFDAAVGDAPYEETYVTDRGLFASFPDRVREHTAGWGYKPLLDDVWPCVVRSVEGGATLGEAVVRMRRCVERAWGVANLELPVSRLADTLAFARFAAHVLLDLPRFADAYNGAIRDYRRANGLHSKNHPAPELARDADWLEAPFWVWRTGAGRRERLFVRRAGSEIEARAGGRLIRRLPTDLTGLVEEWATFQRSGWRFRPRALSLTLFVRVCLADGFLHGIGGGKYDEVTDAIIRRFFGIDPPGFAVVTATLRLPIPRFPATAGDLRTTERTIRDLNWKPEKNPAVQSRFPELVAEKTALVAAEPTDRAARREWFRSLQRVTRGMRPTVEAEVVEAEARLVRVRRELTANEILTSREYSWVMFPESHIRDFLTTLV